MKSAAKKAGSMVKKGVKSVGKKAVSTAGKVAGEFSAAKAKQKAKAMARPEKKKETSKSDDDDGTGGKLDALLAEKPEVAAVLPPLVVAGKETQVLKQESVSSLNHLAAVLPVRLLVVL